ncbi:MAG: CZB domain-containing protein [Campylobacterota bacterium]|nr:CZB domain-containing protein [Campylobacterota bacterium]
MKSFFDRNIIRQSIPQSEVATIKQQYNSSLLHLCKGKLDDFYNDYRELTNLYIRLEVPYVALINEINHMQHILMELFISYDKKDEIITIYKLTVNIQNIIAKIYFDIYAKNLISLCNNRLSSLSDMVEKFVVDHLVWLIDIAKSLTNNNKQSFPQTDKTMCGFGKWLISDAKKMIKNNSKLKELERVHSQLHYISIQIKQILISNEDYDYDILLTYLEKCELLSLSIGTELALIDNTIINQKAIKDTLTGAIGRQGLA